ncbi:MAG: PAS domain S-box protein, partial [Chroococcales cyanobacterium]
MNAVKHQRILGKHQSSGRINYRGRLIIAIPVVCFLASTLIIAGLRSKTIELREKELQHRQIVTETQSLTRALTEAQTSIYAYALTERGKFLETYSEAIQLVPKALKQLSLIVVPGSEQEIRLTTIQRLTEEELVLLDTTQQRLKGVTGDSQRSEQLAEQWLFNQSQMTELRSQVKVFEGEALEIHRNLENQVLLWRNITTQVQWLTLGISLVASAIAIRLFYQLEQKLSERATSLKESHLRQQAIFDNVVDGIIILDARGYIESWNTAAGNIFGYEATEIAGKHLQRLVKDSFTDSGDALFYFLGDQHSKLYRFQEVMGRRKDGTTFPMELAISQLKVENQHRLITIVRDITERKEWAAQLERQAHLLDLANDTIIIKDLSDRILYWNQGARRLYGWTASEAIGQPFSRLIHTQFPQPIEEIKTHFFQKGEWKGELIQVNKEGQLLTVASSWTLQRDSRGNPIAHLEINKDITEAKSAEVALRKSEELYRTLVTNFPNGTVLLFDLNLYCTIAEGRGIQQMNLQADTISGKTLRELLPLSISEEIVPLCEQALSG